MMKNPGKKVDVCETNKLPLHNFIPDITSLSPRVELVVGRGVLARLIVTISRATISSLYFSIASFLI